MVPGHHQKGKVRYKVKSGVEDVKPGTSHRYIFEKLRSYFGLMLMTVSGWNVLCCLGITVAASALMLFNEPVRHSYQLDLQYTSLLCCHVYICRADLWRHLSNLRREVKSPGTEGRLQQITSCLLAWARAKRHCQFAEAVLSWPPWTGSDCKTHAKVWTGFQWVSVTIVLNLFMEL